MKPTDINGRSLRVALLVNTHSRKGRLLYKHAKAHLEAAGYSFVRAIALADPTALPEAMQGIMKLDPELVIIGGGDGTISTASSYLAYTDTVLGYLPLGTTNNFGRGLGLRPRLRDALDAITGGKVTQIDLGKVSGRYFTNMASFGVSVAVATETPRSLKRIFGRIVYAAYSAISTLRHTAMSVQISTDLGRHTFTTHQLCVVSGVTHSGIPIAADASTTDHKLMAYALGGPNQLSTLVATIKHGLTSQRAMADKDLLISATFALDFTTPQSIDIDGEVPSTPPQTHYALEVAPAALKVLVRGDLLHE